MQVIFRGCYLRHFTVQDDDGGVFTRAHFTASFSKPICEALGWEEFSEHVKSAKLDGELRATNLVLTPNGNLAKFKLEFEVTEVSDFTFKRTSDDTLLEFVVRSSSEGVPAWLENHKRRIGDAQGQLKITYSADQGDPQAELPLAKGEEEEPEAASAPGSVASARVMKARTQ